MAFEIVLSPEAVEDRSRLRAFDRAALDDALERHLRHDPTRPSRSRIKRLKGMKSPQYRLRVDELRVFFDVIGQEVQILGIVLKSEAQGWLNASGEP